LLPDILIWVQQLPIKPNGFYTNPFTGSLPHPN
jgi:hypothetical protein